MTVNLGITVARMVVAESVLIGEVHFLSLTF